MNAHVASSSHRLLTTQAWLGCALLTLAAALVLVPAAEASQSWPGIQAEVYAGKTLHDGRGVLTLKAPYRPDDVRSVPLEADAKFADGRTIKSVTFIVDENPSPVAAAFRMAGSRPSVHLLTHIRLDQQSDVRVIVEASDGALYMVEQLVKFAGGQASCSAPPMGDPAEIIASMGKMDFAQVGDKAKSSNSLQRARLTLSHPNHTGMVLDQITLLYVPMLMVNHIEARQGDELVFDMTGSITLAQNPVVEFDYVTNGADEMTTVAKDTSGAAWQKRFPIGPAS
jgi:sulfur-oxidizing protein SoxY